MYFSTNTGFVNRLKPTKTPSPAATDEGAETAKEVADDMLSQAIIRDMKTSDIKAKLKQFDFLRYSPFSTGMLSCELRDEANLKAELEKREVSHA